MHRLSIRQRMLVCLLVLLIPMCFFVSMLVAEINKHIDFAKREIAGVHLQQPLTRLQGLLLMAHNENALAKVDAATLLRLRDTLAEFERALKNEEALLSAEIETQPIIANVSNIISGDATALANASKTAEAVNSLIAKISDESGLTLDPDVDSYYLMDAVAFAIPGLVDHLMMAELMLTQLANGSATLANQDIMSEVLLAKHAIQDDEGPRVMASLATAKENDEKYYGESATLKRLDSLAAALQGDMQKVVTLLQTALADGKLPDLTTIKGENVRAMESVIRLAEVGQEELLVLLSNRIDYYQSYRSNLLLKGGITAVIAIILFFLVMQSIVRPLGRIHDCMLQLADGKHQIDIPHTEQKDEVGQMAKALLVFKENAAFIERVSGEFESSVIHAVELVASVAKEIDAAARDLTTQAGEGHVRLAELCKDIEVVSGGSREISAAGEQLKAAINEISAQVSVSAGTTAKAAEQAVHVRETALLLEQATDKISNVVTIISSITSKITLLALNATIESARAGEAGKGFAVVASEVKLLARQTEDSTSEIAQAVAAIQQSSALTLTAIQSIGDIIKQLSEGATVIAAAVEEQGAVADNIAQNMFASSGRLESVSSNANALINLTASSSAAATQSMQASIEFSGQFDKLRTEVKHFVGMMRGEGKAA